MGRLFALGAGDALEFRVLGPLEIMHRGRSCTPSAPKVLQVLAMLVLRANRIVHIDSLIEELWGDRPPRSALTTIQTYIYQLRRFLEREGFAEDGEEFVLTRAPGYILRVRPEQVDLQRFLRLADSGRAHLRERRYAEAARHLRAALELWAGSPLANVPTGGLLSASIANLQEQQLAVLQLRIQAEMEMGLHRELIGELRSLVALHPLDEWLHGQLIRVLDRSGRRGDALMAYHRLRATLDEELGLPPSPEIQQIHHQLLRAS
ncbi:AfsR/SARP family transcriptional regulator [Micromonospora sp. KC213]|uniref:AfsR/SARP family transcriptional regulator n=1 Tax=Micromonospora sp. KC213 TaxID=2530378 RepID=UPI0010455E54|nr:AfsR/SARP family transcriptional regulator [Micromonospora sp. KC213]TDC42884.1 SARP family transcriptional regulator [Micromonospora sp. KC213]